MANDKARTWNGDDCDQDTRLEMALRHNEGTDPRATFDDWGDYDVDHPVETQEDVKASSVEEIEDYYNENRPSGWWPL